MKRRICLVLMLLIISSVSFVYADTICEHEKYNVAYEKVECKGLMADQYHWERRRCAKCEYEWKVLCKHDFGAVSKEKSRNTIKYTTKCSHCGYVKTWSKTGK